MLRSTRLIAIVLSIALLVPVAIGATTLINTINNSTANESHSFKNFDVVTSALADFNGDGVPEIVTQNDNKYVYVLATKTPTVLAEFLPPYPSGWGARPLSDPAVMDVDGDGLLEIVVVTSAGSVCAYEYGSGFHFTKRWCTTMDKHDSPGADAGPAVGDVNGDGKMEVFSQVEKRGLYAFNWDGSIRWSKSDWGGNSGPLLTDLEGDGKKEIIFFGDGGEVKAFDASSGASKWSFHSNKYVSPASIPVAGNAADIDGDGKFEVVFTARDAPAGNTDYKKNHLMVFVLSHTGGLQARWQPPWANPLSYTHPVLIDVNGDGVKDILLQDWNTIGHKPGNWEKLGPANVFAYTHSGSFLWRTVLDNSWSNDPIVVADVDGDGAQEVLAIGYNGGQDGIWYLDLRTGAKEAHVSVGSGQQVLRGPIAGNVDGSGKTGWAVSLSGGAWKVFRTDAKCNVAYGGWQVKNPCGGGSSGGGGGGGGVGGGTPPPTGGPVTFTHGGGNEWWVEVKVTPTPSAVDAMDTNGAWVPLELKSWGEWAESFHIEPGHEVRFRATSGGTTTESCWYSHPQGMSRCGSPPPGGGSPPPSGTATFTHGGGNEWWVEVKVTPTPSAVDAMDTNGAWVPLELKSWGEWAGSFHVEPGHEVRFRATVGGKTTESCWFTHPQGVSRCGSPPPSSGGSFTAAWKNVRGNDWWIETDVTTQGGSLSGVDARVNGGSWTALDKRSYGSWAKSIHAVDGSGVEFRARATDGQTATSGKYTWPP